MEIARIVLSVLMAVLLLVTGGGKILDLPFSRGNRDRLSVHPTFWRVTGLLEVLATVGLAWGIWFVPFGLAAAVGVDLLMIGALVFRLRTRDPAIRREGIADVVVFLLALIVVVLSILALVR